MPSIFVALLDMSQYNRDSDLSMGWTRLSVFSLVIWRVGKLVHIVQKTHSLGKQV